MIKSGSRKAVSNIISFIYPWPMKNDKNAKQEDEYVMQKKVIP